MTCTIIKMDEGQWTGCGLCIPNCPEGALQVLDGKARLLGGLLRLVQIGRNQTQRQMVVGLNGEILKDENL